MFTLREKTASNIEAFGFYEAAKILKRQRVPFSIAYWCIFLRAPNAKKAPPCNAVQLETGKSNALRIAQFGAWLEREGK